MPGTEEQNLPFASASSLIRSAKQLVATRCQRGQAPLIKNVSELLLQHIIGHRRQCILPTLINNNSYLRQVRWPAFFIRERLIMAT
jgi:hypothetical protein